MGFYSVLLLAKWEKVVKGGIENRNWGLKSCFGEGMNTP